MAKRIVTREEAEQISVARMSWQVYEDGGVVDEFEFISDVVDNNGQLLARYYLRNRNAGNTPVREGEFKLLESVVREWCAEELDLRLEEVLLWYES